MDVEAHFFNRYRNKRNGVEFDGVWQRIGTPSPKHLGMVQILYRINVKPKRKLTCEILANEVFGTQSKSSLEIKWFIEDKLIDAGFNLNKTYFYYENELNTVRTFIQYL